MSNNNDIVAKVYSLIEASKEKVKEDYYRCNYHIMPPVGFLNDPNGFIQINGWYHLFYQFNPAYPNGKKLVCWAHVRSKDLVNWEELPVALFPSQWYETHGCYSGSAVNNNGTFTLMYTGNVKNSLGDRETYQCIATTEDGVEFTKYEKNPVISNEPEGYTRHFRDPKVLKHKEAWYAVIGAQRKELIGETLLYKSLDLIKWTKIGELFNQAGELGYMCECPNLLNIEDKDVLIFCPQGMKSEGDLYNNIYQCGYFIGKLDYSTGRFEGNKFIELDRGFEFYAPQVTKDEKGRNLIIGWMGLPEEENSPNKEYGWMHILTIPRELFIKDGKLMQKPIEELKLLRREEISIPKIKLNNEEIMLSNLEGDSFEIICEMEYSKAEYLGLKMRHGHESEGTIISYDVKAEKLVLDRENTSLLKREKRRCSIKNSGKIKLHIFMDKSSIEVFVNDGEETFTSRIYPRKEDNKISLFCKGGSLKAELKFWNI